MKWHGVPKQEHQRLREPYTPGVPFWQALEKCHVPVGKSAGKHGRFKGLALLQVIRQVAISGRK